MGRTLLATLLLTTASVGLLARAAEPAGNLALHTRSRGAGEDGSLAFTYKTVQWDPAKTAIVVCDMWDKHWCRGATERVAEMAPRMNRFLEEARRRGVLVVHAPSSCMDAYKEHPARRRAREAPKADLPGFLAGWNQKLDSEKDAAWPVDQSDGGCTTPGDKSHQAWSRQIDALRIDDADAVSDSGVEIGNLFRQRGIENVMLVGVHTNMCVIGRPFGLRNMVRFGMNTLLVRDLTDSMYNPERSPKVSHVRGTELVVEYIERHVCPTITSTDLLGEPAFRFKEDSRPHVAFLVSDDHYHADKTLPVFAQMLREKHGCHCTVLHGEGTANIANTEELAAADVVVLFVRRLALPKEQLDRLRAYLDSGKPLVGLRTASHAFDVQGKGGPGTAEWPAFDAEVLGGHYHGHGPNAAGAEIAILPEKKDHPIVAGIEPATWHSNGSLYFASPINDDATLLMTGSVQGKTEPVTWTRTYKGGRVCYSSLGHWDDFKSEPFQTMLTNAIFWAMGKGK
jgi:type 1 glutamine amidotransferase/nicotinamidase-related amidase